MPEMNGQAIGITDFTGEFVRWHYRPGQKFIQLIFRTPEGECLSLSRNAQMARSLVPGEFYAVQGEVRTLGARQYVHEPTATPVDYQSDQAPADEWQGQPFIKAHKGLVITASVLLAIIVGAGIFAFIKHRAIQNRPVSSQTPSVQSAEDIGEVQGANTTAGESTLTPTAQDNATTPVPSSPATTANVTKPKTPAAQQTTQPDTTQPAATTPAPVQPETPTEPTPTPVEPTPSAPEPTPDPEPTPAAPETPAPEPTNP